MPGTVVTPGEGSSSYAYLSDGALNETTIRGQVLVLWSLRPLAESGTPTLYRYRLPDEREADLQFKSIVRMTCQGRDTFDPESRVELTHPS